VGIFESFKLKQKFKMWVGLRTMSRAELLKQLFQGQVASSTEAAGRGNGIPRIYEHCKSQRIRNLTVVTNNVKGEAESDRYDVLGPVHTNVTILG
jgi:putative methionine-R-sulfoxide reductase with GAF domain